MHRSSRSTFLIPLAAALAALAATPAAAQTRPGAMRDLGRIEYESNCASCHGAQGKGDGPLRPFLASSAPDLSGLARDNGGALPVSRLYAVIEGGPQATAHGTSEMPVWGRTYRMRAAEYYGEVPYDPDAFVRARILALIDYVARLQTR